MGNDRKLTLSDIKNNPNFSIAISEKVELKPLNVSGISNAYVEGLNDPDVNRFLIGPRSEKQTHSTVEAFVKSNFIDPNAVLFGFYINKVLCGTCRLHDITDVNAYMGLAIFAKSEWGKGYGTAIIKAVTEFSYTELALKEIKAGVEIGNKGSRQAFEKVGFTLDEERENPQTWKINLEISQGKSKIG